MLTVRVGSTAIRYVWLMTSPCPSSAVRITWLTPTWLAVGVQLTTPVRAFTVSPAGPAVRPKVTGTGATAAA